MRLVDALENVFNPLRISVLDRNQLRTLDGQGIGDLGGIQDLCQTSYGRSVGSIGMHDDRVQTLVRDNRDRSRADRRTDTGLAKQMIQRVGHRGGGHVPQRNDNQVPANGPHATRQSPQQRLELLQCFRIVTGDGHTIVPRNHDDWRLGKRCTRIGFGIRCRDSLRRYDVWCSLRRGLYCRRRCGVTLYESQDEAGVGHAHFD